MNPGRNDPCPCGSGRKYKKCCEPATHVAVNPAVARADAAKEADSALTLRILRFAHARAGTTWLPAAFDLYVGGTGEAVGDAELQLAVPWAMFNAEADDGITMAAMFRHENATRLPKELRELLDAQMNAWLGIWDVRRVERGVGMQVTDLLSGEERFVHEINGSEAIEVRAVILGRVVDVGGVTIFGGIHPNPLEPMDADIVVREVRRLCRVRTRPIAVERLRQPRIELALIDTWRDIAEREWTRPAPRITNTDGDPLLLTTDHFDVLTSGHSALLARIATLAGAEEPDVSDSDDGETIITVTKPGNAKTKLWDNTIIGRIVIKGQRMRVESNSTRRADTLRASVTEHLGPLVKYRMRDETPQEEMMRRASEPHEPRSAAQGNSPEAVAVMREFKERYMLDWLDQEVPALGGLTPREAAKSPRSRKDIEVLLRDLENHEGRLPESERFDVDRLRAVLGLEDRKSPAT
jgi:hypothetical protein